MKNLLIIGASNYLSQEIIKNIPKSSQVVGVSIEENTDRHQEYLKLESDNLKKEILDITKNDLSWLDNLIEKYGDFDGLIYVPCQNAMKPFDQITKQDFDQAVLINGKLPFLISQKLVDGMKRLGHGRMVYIGTIWSIKGHPELGQEYAITKAMENQLAKQITAVYIQDNITATSLIFGSVNLHLTSKNEKPLFTEKDRVIEHKEMAKYILELLDEKNRMFAGSTILLDNGTLSIAGINI